jgi:glucose-1-phosphate adenylyltransferase
MKTVLAMILAGGGAKSMDVLCHGRGKASLPFAGKFRLIDLALTNCVRSRIRDIAILTDYHRSNMANYLSQWCVTNASDYNLFVLEPKVSSYRGTADAVLQNIDYLQRHSANAILILTGDHVYRMDYGKMLAFHQKMRADVTVGVASVPIARARRFGVVKVTAESRVVDFLEKPRIPRRNLVSMGIYIFTKEVLVERITEDATDPSSRHDFGHDIVPKMVNTHNVIAYRFDDYWRDIGDVQAYYQANMELTRQVPPFSLEGRWPILTEDMSLLPPKISERGSVKHSLISPGCVIKGDVQNSILSPLVRVEEKAVIMNSVIMAETSIGEQSIVNCCILDEEVSVGGFCYVGFGASPVPGDWDITVLGKGVTVPTQTAIGRNCKLMPNVTPADFTTNVVPPNSVVSRR